MSTHNANIHAVWNGGFNGQGRVIAPGFSTAVSLPKEFGGRGEGASPEDLFLSSIASCYLITLGIILDKAGVSYESLSVGGSLLTKTGPPAAMEEVKLTVRIQTATDVQKLEQLATRVDDFCLVSKAIGGGLKKTVEIVRLRPANQAGVQSET